MVCNFKLKTGFFETKKCTLFVRDKAISVFYDNECDDKGLTIMDNDLLSISAIVRSNDTTEIRIHTLDNIYTGFCIDEDKVEKIIKSFVNEFKSKVSIEH